jgi:hypothetical protein
MPDCAPVRLVGSSATLPAVASKLKITERFDLGRIFAPDGESSSMKSRCRESTNQQPEPDDGNREWNQGGEMCGADGFKTPAGDGLLDVVARNYGIADVAIRRHVRYVRRP